MFVFSINERTSGLYIATLADETGTPIVGSVIETATMSLFEANGGAIVNSWNVKDMLTSGVWTFYNALQSIVINGVTKTYNMAWLMASADAQIIANAVAVEPHIAEIKLTWGSGLKVCTHRFELDVVNFATIT